MVKKPKIITEHSTKIRATLPKGDVNSRMEVFYNPLMVSNRNISITLLNSLTNKNMKITLPLAGSGIRGIRFLQELKKDKMEVLFVNDKKENFQKTFTDNLELNKLNPTSAQIHTEDANMFLLNQAGFDYIDLDPFGTPNPFLASAVARISRKGILAITATDTAALSGTYPKSTQRKYWSKSLKCHLMHEIGLRILIRKVQLQGVQFEKALVPIVSYHKDHYFRIYFLASKGKELCDVILNQHQYLLYCPGCSASKVSKYNIGTCSYCKKKYDYAGPMWVGDLLDSKLVKKMAKQNKFPEEQKFLDLLAEESTKPLVGFYDLHVLAKKHKLKAVKNEIVLDVVKGTRTHFSTVGIRSKKKIVDFVKIIKKK